MTLRKIEQWHQKARPQPDRKAFNVQLGCHLEEIAEMLDSLDGDRSASNDLTVLTILLEKTASSLKNGRTTFTVKDRKGLLDSLADQIVTAVGVGHCAGMHITEACEQVNTSNWSKFINGEPIFDANGKVKKAEEYREPDLTGLY